MNSRSVTFFILALFLCAPAVSAKELAGNYPIRIMIKDYGRYELLEKSATRFKADSTAGYDSIIQTRFLEATTQVPLKEGQVFGFNFMIEDNTVDVEWVPVIIQITHPTTRNYLGHSSEGFSQQSYARLKADGRYHNGAFYVFSEDYELKPGEWLIKVIYRNEMTASKMFEVK